MLPRLAATPNRSPEPPAKAAPAAPTPTDPTTPCTSTLSTCVLRVFLMVSHSDWKKPLPDSKARIRADSQYLPDSSAARFCSLSMSLAASTPACFCAPDTFAAARSRSAFASRFSPSMISGLRMTPSARLAWRSSSAALASMVLDSSSANASLVNPMAALDLSCLSSASCTVFAFVSCALMADSRALLVSLMASASAFKPATM